MKTAQKKRTNSHHVRQVKLTSSKPAVFSALLGSWYGVVLLFLIGLVGLVIFLSLFASKTAHLVSTFQKTTQLSWSELATIGHLLITTQPTWRVKNILLLGTDDLSTRGDKPSLTDTILLISLNPITSTITLLPIPRDTWVDSQNSKINAVYSQQRSKNSTSALQQTELIFEKILDIPIDHTLVVSMDMVKDLIDAVGGVTIDVPTSFTDYAFPRMDVDVTRVTDPQLLYETVSFTQGQTEMDGITALKFMRSRHALGPEGNDMARSRRQQLVITALMDKIKQRISDQSFLTLLPLFKVYRSYLESQFPITDATRYVAELPGDPRKYTFASAALPIIPASSSGVLIHPAQHYSGEWVFTMTSPEDFQLAVQKRLGMSQL